MIKFQIRFSLSLSFLQFVQQTRTAVSSVPWIHVNQNTDVCSSSVYVTTPGIELRDRNKKQFSVKLQNFKLVGNL